MKNSFDGSRLEQRKPRLLDLVEESDLEKINGIIKDSFGIELNDFEAQKLLSSEQVLTIMFDKEGEMQFAIVKGAEVK
jgi:hypothetical protein